MNLKNSAGKLLTGFHTFTEVFVFCKLSVKGLVITCSGGEIAFAFLSMCSISNLDPIAFLQGNASKNIHDIESMSFCRGLKNKAGLC